MRKFFGKFVSVTLAAAVIAMFALSSDDKWCSRVDKAFDESALGSFLNESKAGYGRYATGLPGQAASVLADSRMVKMVKTAEPVKTVETVEPNKA